MTLGVIGTFCLDVRRRFPLVTFHLPNIGTRIFKSLYRSTNSPQSKQWACLVVSNMFHHLVYKPDESLHGLTLVSSFHGLKLVTNECSKQVLLLLKVYVLFSTTDKFAKGICTFWYYRKICQNKLFENRK